MLDPLASLTRDQFLIDLEKLRFPVVNYRRTAYLGYSVLDFWGLALALFMLAAPMCGWIHYESPTLSVAFWVGGICLYIHGIFNWYQGRSMLSVIDFIFGLLFLTIYYTAELGKYAIYVPYEYHTYMQGVFCIVFLLILMFILMSLASKGSIYTLNIHLIILGLVFTLMWHFSKENWSRKIAGYCYVCAAASLFITGLGRFLTSMNHSNCFPFCYPYL